MAQRGAFPPNGVLQCSICAFRSSNFPDIRAHVEASNAQRVRFHCPACGQAACGMYQLSNGAGSGHLYSCRAFLQAGEGFHEMDYRALTALCKDPSMEGTFAPAEIRTVVTVEPDASRRPAKATPSTDFRTGRSSCATAQSHLPIYGSNLPAVAIATRSPSSAAYPPMRAGHDNFKPQTSSMLNFPSEGQGPTAGAMPPLSDRPVMKTTFEGTNKAEWMSYAQHRYQTPQQGSSTRLQDASSAQKLEALPTRQIPPQSMATRRMVDLSRHTDARAAIKLTPRGGLTQTSPVNTASSGAIQSGSLSRTALSHSRAHATDTVPATAITTPPTTVSPHEIHLHHRRIDKTVEENEEERIELSGLTLREDQTYLNTALALGLDPIDDFDNFFPRITVPEPDPLLFPTCEAYSRAAAFANPRGITELNWADNWLVPIEGDSVEWRMTVRWCKGCNSGVLIDDASSHLDGCAVAMKFAYNRNGYLVLANQRGASKRGC
ncbi:Hypothetical predicted protein [Lecanosticta acicola]|uniref:Uncharacterized protein n=1 Tax=Lecanosticta acicola TaxID=111012 RepID=A0AAI8YW34_9PEZI|nr:Hypothetical predicted protein [Lecanosticta acicola]